MVVCSSFSGIPGILCKYSRLKYQVFLSVHPPTPLCSILWWGTSALLGNLWVFTQEEKDRREIAKTSKFFLFFPLSEKCSPPFPSTLCNALYLPRKAFSLLFRHWLDCDPFSPASLRVQICICGVLYLFFQPLKTRPFPI